MHVLITGAGGFIGQILAKELLSTPEYTVTLTDVFEPPIPPGSKHPENARTVAADLSTTSSTVITKDLNAVFIFHGIMSSGAEANFELGYKINVTATQALLENLRQTVPGVRVLYASSEAVYGNPLPKRITETHLPTPESSYGTQKMICELLINDYTRRGYINGLSLRFPTIAVRPGKPTQAASSFISGIIREPMSGIECVVPLRDRKWSHWMCSPKTLVYNLIVALKLEEDALPLHIRAINMPGFRVTVQDMLDALEEVDGKDKLKLVREEDDEDVKRILYSWADDFDNSLALTLGMRQDTSFVRSVRDYAEELEESSRASG
jgi:nucleoside-diphosphate-sugar epimerase